MIQYETQETRHGGQARWIRFGTANGLLGGVLLAVLGLVIHTGLTDAQFEVANPLGAVAMVLLVAALPVFYLHERHWFGRLATAGFWLTTAGWVATAVTMALFALGSEMAGLVFVPAWLVAMLGAFALGVAMLRSDDVSSTRLSAWLFVAALPVGLALSVAVTWFAFGRVDTPWNGPLVLYALAWVVFCARAWSGPTDTVRG
ncbi:hypothetical protein C2R22_10360 [Salinigranum rubrum]|uniref:Uncharacterized protein n=1 Tax=Salinigranum rubrum TaxID=755307 RepID=A0A2I8VJ95_9EURY|nr:hypothetical protein [Salinigranum rubrum]AUV82002.1 hypothetical protein C2R22_10360 [Salinigranum rubrum]